VSSFPPFLGIVILGAILGVILTVVAVVRTVRYHGWGKQQLAPPAVPWLIASFVVPAISLAIAFLVM
jgi:hypothetical protein